ncbi:choline/Carnitine o-acyltransferase-like protein [Leptomonas pyrrhocoris]|uniref:Choline/Carnitine o-acyltransferase-like protein n=1 Tax=Leptomonas pyrrhocoris TaxID=157538 RepID=A0A0N0VGG8_LEPPY|nr:choline/Carnitine o-acyltransferase-like protein [Leptomonas pyrrhocoris]KPA82938.1 choline/Carnitine o-acyltransferase-like protein [Leptomonas pyrrhocoris]|eukprot:XP_015661377.1 choline/Carnitine o-acyltransferase-like protein [Leptomonas pyrrhocoris]
MAEAFLSQQPHPSNQTAEAGASMSKMRVSWTNNGVDVHVPPMRYLWRGVNRTLVDNLDKVSAMFYPLPFSCVVFCIAGSCVYVWRVPATSWVHTNPVSTWLRYFDSILTPFSRYIPLAAQAPVLCAKVWVVALGGAAVLHRFALRRLLQYKGWMLEKDPQKPSWKTRLWSLVVRTFFTRPTIPKTGVYESCLPSLPLPSLQHTVNHYLSSMRAIYHQKDSDTNDWLELRRSAESFLLNEGPALQKHLRLQHVMTDNYIAESWKRNVFLSARTSLCLHSNFYVVPFANHVPTHLPEARAAVIIYLLTQLKSRIERRTLCPNFVGPRHCVPLSMDQYAMAFNTTRIPGREVDFLEHHEERENQYIVILHRGRVYQVPVVDPQAKRQLTPHQLEIIFHQLLQEVEEEVSTGRDESEEDDAEDTLETLGKKRSYRVVESLVPALTTASRAQWADVRTAFFLHDSNNSAPLRVIEKAMFVVSFDERCGSPTTPSTTSASVEEKRLSADCTHYLCGNGSNLWCDKSFNLVIRADAHVGLHVEHSWCDMSTFLGLMEHVSAQEEAAALWYDSETGSARKLPEDQKRKKAFHAPQLDSPLCPKRLRFTIYKKLADAIREAHTEFMLETGSQVDLHVVRYDGYGCELPKTMGCSPDAWVQLAIQLAYYTNQDAQFSQIYESVAQHMFAKGRTEAVRSVSEASSAFVKAMVATTADDEEDAPSLERKRELLMEACSHHQHAVQAAVSGRGFDRHLFALFMASVNNATPSDFLTAVLRKTQWKVSTSQARQRYLMDHLHPAGEGCVNHETPGFGFGPVAPDGYGISYCYCANEVLYLTITSCKNCDTTSARTLGNQIVTALDALGELVRPS